MEWFGYVMLFAFAAIVLLVIWVSNYKHVKAKDNQKGGGNIPDNNEDKDNKEDDKAY